ncbi:MAG: DNA-3-methyladenine glycosylase [Pseudomonadota bacterium]|jgi:DNA-3-methyladenine glycosylase|nr:DNA-3-methyladenine glycosylase [Alphaproteobacteria bacterium]
MERLSLSFFSRHTVEVAKGLIGKTLVFGKYQGIIWETEAYRGLDDEASHAFRKTPRSSIMFGRAGMSYVYFIYGKYHCLNIVSEQDGEPGAVLIRGIKLIKPSLLLNGPGKLCQTLGITKLHNGLDLLSHEDFYVMEGQENASVYQATPRIGIRKAVDKHWRFVAALS